MQQNSEFIPNPILPLCSPAHSCPRISRHHGFCSSLCNLPWLPGLLPPINLQVVIHPALSPPQRSLSLPAPLHARTCFHSHPPPWGAPPIPIPRVPQPPFSCLRLVSCHVDILGAQNPTPLNKDRRASPNPPTPFPPVDQPWAD